ncbi:potassium channel subfamily K member 18-like isoform X1 [Episyrphus balteatus]|uniref:potassium channel subfamily K member 18-like isoform X1 n=2 Tax=Episyrphus balteatus TaxID=286459 RepID=UPI002485D321|nr:potassium channel subfamily K member 18-like isoform X1 [Episyrphus balteatus]XP_055856614.1 potassium channel subfamily K member 18-like isoform X1 [Episyrphus balteatus]
MNKKPPPPIQLTTFVGSVKNPTSPSMCFPSSKNEKQREHHPGLCGCQRAPKSHCISATGVLILVLLYTAMGSIIFVTLEGEVDDSNSLETAVAASKPYPRTELANAEIRSRTVDRLWSITEDLNILYKENWTRLAAQEVQHFQDTLLRAVRQSKVQQPGVQLMLPTGHKWSYASAFLYSLTLITTIGYGGVSPRTQWGRIAALIYALFGIPIILLYLSAMGEGLSSAMRCLFRKTRSKNSGGTAGTKAPPQDTSSSAAANHFAHHTAGKIHHYTMPSYQLATSPSVPISICIMVLICYVTLGAVIFHKMQNWSVLESLYFCFTSLGTIGFGDLAPTGNLSLYLASGYILIGMAVVAMCFSLIQTEIILWLRKFSVQDHVLPASDDVALVSVSVTPKS